jgi:hypothetical protein
MSLITDELVRVVRTATPCRHNASARRAENVLSSYHLCLVTSWAVFRVFVCVARPGRSGRPARLPGIVTYLVCKKELIDTLCWLHKEAARTVAARANADNKRLTQIY